MIPTPDEVVDALRRLSAATADAAGLATEARP
jgi:hypothetical protein